MEIILKICGLTRRDDAALAVAAGATHLGFVFHPASPRVVEADTVAKLHAGLAAVNVGVFVDFSPDEVLRCMQTAQLDVAQLHGNEAPADFKDFPLPIWRALRSVEQAKREADRWPQAELFVLDLAAGDSLGGSGKPGDDGFAAGFALRHPALLAGGLTPETVAARAGLVMPRGVDVSGGVEDAPGIKNEGKMRRFLNAARLALQRPATL